MKKPLMKWKDEHAYDLGATSASPRIGIACGMLILLLATFVVAAGHRQGNNFITFGTLWASGKAAADGLNPYAAYPETFRGLNYTPSGIQGTFPDLNLNPPWSLPVLQSLARLPLSQFMRAWTLITAGCYFAGLLLMLYTNPALQGRQVMWFVLAMPTLSTLYAGQVYGWAFLAGALALYCYDREELLGAGMAVGIGVAIRPTIGFWILLLIIGRFRRIGVIATATCVGLYVVPLITYGPPIFTEWLGALSQDRHWLNPYNIAIIPTLSRLGHPSIGVAIAIFITVLVCVWTVRYKPDFISTSGAALCLGILCAPLAWYHYLLFLAPFLMARRWTSLTTLGACLFLVPAVALPDAACGMMYLFGVVILLTTFLVTAPGPSQSGHAMKLQDPPPPRAAACAEIARV